MPYAVAFDVGKVPYSLNAVGDTHGGELEAWLLSSRDLPIISLNIAFRRAGSSYIESDKAGLPKMLSHMLRQGAGDMDATSFAKALEDKSIELDAYVDKDNLYISLKTLSQHKDEAFRLLGLMLSSPRFEEEDFARVLSQMQAGLKSKFEKPDYHAHLTLNRLAYADHPYSTPLHGTQESLQNITRRDLELFRLNHLLPSRMVISAVGDISEQELRRLLQENLAALPTKFFSPREEQISISPLPSYEDVYGDVPPCEEKNNTKLVIKCKSELDPATSPYMEVTKIEMDIPQSVALLGTFAHKVGSPQHEAQMVLNYILGGGSFQSRMMTEIRQNRGLAYSAYSYINEYEHSAMLKAYVGTKAENMDMSVQTLRGIISQLRDEGVTQEEFELAVRYLKGSFAISLDSNEKIASHLLWLQLNGLSSDYMDIRAARLDALTMEDVNALAAEMLTRPAYLVIVGRK